LQARHYPAGFFYSLRSPDTNLEFDMSKSPVFTCDEEVVEIGRGLFDRTLPKSRWTHAAHFAAAIWVLMCRPDLEAPIALPPAIRAYNESTGVANTDTGGYHETITQASIRAARAPSSPATPHDLFSTRATP
jgi:hypothetical protein